MSSEIEARIRAAVGDDSLDTSSFAVYEARALSTEAIKQPGFFNKARFNRSTLAEMVELLNTPGKAIPLQIMHDNEVLPVGRVFSASLHDLPNGESEVRVQFYLPPSKSNLISDIDNSIIDEVSVGVLTKKALCSECEFDYFGPEATFSNFMNLTCDNDHTIGEDGVHIRAIGLRDWAELSLVNRGAAKDAKILSRAKQAMSEDTVKKLAASAVPMEAQLFTTTNKLEAKASDKQNSKGDLSMDKETLALFQAKTEEAVTLKAKLGEAETKLSGLEDKVAELTATNETLTSEIATLKEASENAAELSAKVTETEKQMTEAVEKLLPHAKAALTASGVADADLPKDLAGLFSTIETAGLKLHQVFGSEPKAVEAKLGTKEVNTSQFRNEAFKTR